ncbi:MAG: hypothetical protein EBX23_06445 [Proteobacteria bacterium]|jgi:hypothetical protein|nr:hypothetical protein [Pseudomonadota bacterium]
MLLTIIEVLKNMIINNSRNALVISVLFILYLRMTSETPSLLFSPLLIFSFISYFLMFSIALDAFKKSKLLGVYLFITVFFIPPNIFENYKGLLFPVTYLSHFSYLLYLLSIELFKKWKNSHEL